MKRILITGGAGFIGANLVKHLLRHDQECELLVIDKLTYAGNERYLEHELATPRVRLERVDIADHQAMRDAFERFDPDGVYHLAAESHVDRSIEGPAAFIHTNIVGTFVLLECLRERHAAGAKTRLLHVSTDEVFGELDDQGLFTEQTPYNPSSPYSASKASSDHLVRAYGRTYGLDVVLTNCSNNFGPYQYPEKLIPVVIQSIIDGRPVPVYGQGLNVRDWLYVEDHCSALRAVYERGESGRSYNIGTHNEWRNIDLVRLLCRQVDEALGREGSERLITFVEDRPGHDKRYAIDASRLREELDWRSEHAFEESLRYTVDWYLEHLPTTLWSEEGQR